MFCSWWCVCDSWLRFFSPGLSWKDIAPHWQQRTCGPWGRKTRHTRSSRSCSRSGRLSVPKFRSENWPLRLNRSNRDCLVIPCMGSKTPEPTFPRMSGDLTGKFHVCSLMQTFYVCVLAAEVWHSVHQKTFSGYAHDVLHVFFGACGFLFWHGPAIQHTALVNSQRIVAILLQCGWKSAWLT